MNWLLEICTLPLILIFNIYERDPNSSNFGLWSVLAFVLLIIVAVKKGILSRNTLTSTISWIKSSVKEVSILQKVANNATVYTNIVKSYYIKIYASFNTKLNPLQQKIKTTLSLIFNLVNKILKK